MSTTTVPPARASQPPGQGVSRALRPTTKVLPEHARRHNRALVLQSPFTSARDMARLIAPSPVLLGWRVIARVHFDTERRVRELDAPVWVAHGERDWVIPTRFGRRVFEAARVKGELLLVPSAGHNDVAEAGGEAYWRWLERAMGRS